MKRLFSFIAVGFMAMSFLTSCEPESENSKKDSGLVDLGLSVKWASCNLGASKPEEYGLYYQWADTQGYVADGSDGKFFNWTDNDYNVSYKWNTVPSITLTKYNGNSSFGTVDNKTVLDLEDDAARVALGGKWRIPSEEEWTELANTDNCIWTLTEINGVKGYKVQSKKSGYTDKWIFLPAAGHRAYTTLDYAGSKGCYWSSVLSSHSYYACDMSLYLDDDKIAKGCSSRCYGLSIRPVSE